MFEKQKYPSRNGHVTYTKFLKLLKDDMSLIKLIPWWKQTCEMVQIIEDGFDGDYLDIAPSFITKKIAKVLLVKDPLIISQVPLRIIDGDLIRCYFLHGKFHGHSYDKLIKCLKYAGYFNDPTIREIIEGDDSYKEYLKSLGKLEIGRQPEHKDTVGKSLYQSLESTHAVVEKEDSILQSESSHLKASSEIPSLLSKELVKLHDAEISDACDRMQNHSNINIRRMDKHLYYLNIARVALQRGTCIRRNYGAIIVKNDRIISTGYTGSPRGCDNCIETGKCKRQEFNIPSGERYELCESVHAECNAMTAANGLDMIGSTLYLAGIDSNGNLLQNPRPCMLCRRQILNSGISLVVTYGKDENDYDIISYCPK